MRNIDLSPLLFLTPLTATVLASQHVMSAQVSFCATTVLVGLIDVVDHRLRTPKPGPLGRVLSRLGGISRRVFLPLLALCPSLLLLATVWSSSQPVAMGLRAAGSVGIALGLVLALLEVSGRGHGHTSDSRFQPTWRLVAEIASAVTWLSPVSWQARADLDRLAQVGYGVVHHPPCAPRVVRYRDVCDLPAEFVAAVVWSELGATAPLLDGARPVSGLECLPEEDEVWLVTAGDLVIGVLTSGTVERSARPSSDRVR